MAQARKQPEKSRGAKRMREQGYRLVQVWLDRNEAALIVPAAKRVGKKLATYIRDRAFRAAELETQAKSKNGSPGSH